MDKEVPMCFENVSFGSIRIDGTTSEHDVVIDRGQIRNVRSQKRKANCPRNTARLWRNGGRSGGLLALGRGDG